MLVSFFSSVCKRFSKEHNEKISKALRGRKHLEETKRKMSKKRKGKNNPMYGRNRSGKNNPMYGKNHTEETKRKISEAKKNISEDTRKKLSDADLIVQSLSKIRKETLNGFWKK